MILSAKKSGADYVKFQIWDPQFLKSGAWDNDGRRKIYEKAALSLRKIYAFEKICKINKYWMFCFSL